MSACRSLPAADELRCRNRRAFTAALLLSALLHGAALFIKTAERKKEDPQSEERHPARIDATLTQSPRSPTPLPAPTPVPPRPDRKPRTRVLSAPAPAKTWTRAEKDEMEQFLKELGAPPRPPTGRELAQRALAMARHMPVPEEADEMDDLMKKLRNANVEPFSLEMYFDAVFRKMNRSAATVIDRQRVMGKQAAAVRVFVHQDGSVKGFTVLWAGDQQNEIAYIKTVVEHAAPFPVFPSDIRSATDTLILDICIQPERYASGGSFFSRLSRGQRCGSADF